MPTSKEKSEHVHTACQVIEIIGSGNTMDFAVKDAIVKAQTAGYTVHSVDIKGFTFKLGEGYRADCKLAVD